MPRNIDDIDDDSIFGSSKSAEDTALKLRLKVLDELKGQARSNRTFSQFSDEAAKHMEDLSKTIAGSKNIFGSFEAEFGKYQSLIATQLKQKIQSGNSMARIEGDMFQIADMRLKALVTVAKDEKMSA